MNKSIRYSPDFRERAVRMVLDHEIDCEPRNCDWTEWRCRDPGVRQGVMSPQARPLQRRATLRSCLVERYMTHTCIDLTILVNEKISKMPEVMKWTPTTLNGIKVPK